MDVVAKTNQDDKNVIFEGVNTDNQSQRHM